MKDINKKVIIIGNGKLSHLILQKLHNFLDNSYEVEKYNSTKKYSSTDIFVHVGSGREYKETLIKAEKYGTSYIQAATEKNISLTKPDNKNIKYIYAPNLDIKIIKLFYVLDLISNIFHEEKMTILESHQFSKKSLPGTAIKIAEKLHINSNDIISIRDKQTQSQLGINNFEQHAYHKIKVGDEESSISFETKIEGGASYVKGLSKIITAFEKINIVGNYEIEELVELGII